MYDDLGWLTVRQLILYHTVLTVHRIRHSQEVEYLASILSRDNPYGKIIITQSNLSLHRISSEYRGVSNWNTLPHQIRQIAAIGAFKKELKTGIKKKFPDLMIKTLVFIGSRGQSELPGGSGWTPGLGARWLRWLLVLPGFGLPMELLLMCLWIQYVCCLSCLGQQASIIVEL